MTESGIPDKYVDFYAGHLGELDRAYQKQTKETLLSMYLRGEPYLRVYDEGFKELAKQQEEIKETKEKMIGVQVESLTIRQNITDMERKHRQEIEDRDKKNLELQKRLNEIEEKQKESVLNGDKIKSISDEIERKMKISMEKWKKETLSKMSTGLTADDLLTG